MKMTREEVCAAFGERLREARARVGMSQSDLWEETGIHQTTISNMENGHRMPNLFTIMRLAAAMEVASCELVPEVEG